MRRSSQKLSVLMWEGPAEADPDRQRPAGADGRQPRGRAASLEAEAGFSLKRDAAFVAGHSLGEYSALAAAGTFSISDAARLLRIRGDAMQKAVPAGEGAMAALLGVELDKRARARGRGGPGPGLRRAANDNGGGQVVLSGAKARDRARHRARRRARRQARHAACRSPRRSIAR